MSECVQSIGQARMRVRVGGHRAERLRGPMRTVNGGVASIKRFAQTGENVSGRGGNFISGEPEIRPESLIKKPPDDRGADKRRSDVSGRSQLTGNPIGGVFIGTRKNESVRVEVRPEPLDISAQQRAQRDFAGGVRLV